MLKRFITFLRVKRADFLWLMYDKFFETDYDEDCIILREPYRLIDLEIEKRFEEKTEQLKLANVEETDIAISYSDDEAPNFEILNLDTGEYILHCIYANQRTGDYEIQVYDVFNNYVGTEDKTGNIVLVYKGE